MTEVAGIAFFIFSVFGILLFLAAIFLYPVIVLRPIIKRIGQIPRSRAKQQILITDFFSLMFLATLPISLMSLTGAQVREIPIVVAVSMCVAGMVWFVTVRVVNRLGTESRWKRSIAVGLLFPLAIIGGIWLVVDLALFNEFYRTVNWLYCLALLGHGVVAVLTFHAAKWIVH